MTHAAHTLSAGLYRDPETYARERKAVFARSWQLLAHESQLPRAGATVAGRFAGYDVFVVRGEDDRIRAFHNVCRHRAGPLVEPGAGACGKQLTCRYHGWRYALDGRLASARDFGPAGDFDVRQYGLIPLAVALWHGFVFVHLDPQAEDFAAFIAPLERRVGDLKLAGLRVVRETHHDIACNWKTYVENYLEGYHIPDVHPMLNGAVDAGRYRVALDPPVVFHEAPPRDGAPVAGLWAWAWPALGVNIYADGVLMERMWPRDHGHTRLEYMFLAHAETSHEALHRLISTSDITTGEDLWITEAVQRNLDAGVYESGRLSPKHEAGVAWFQNQVRHALAAE